MVAAVCVLLQPLMCVKYHRTRGVLTGPDANAAMHKECGLTWHFAEIQLVIDSRVGAGWWHSMQKCMKFL